MTDALANVETLRRFAEDPGDAQAGAWVAERLRRYLDGEAASFDSAFGLSCLRGEDSWRTQEQRRRRDEAIRLAASTFSAGTVTEIAEQVSALSHRYATGRWRRDRDNPPSYQDARNRALLGVLLATDGRPPSVSTVKRALSGEVSKL